MPASNERFEMWVHGFEMWFSTIQRGKGWTFIGTDSRRGVKGGNSVKYVQLRDRDEFECLLQGLSMKDRRLHSRYGVRLTRITKRYSPQRQNSNLGHLRLI